MDVSFFFVSSVHALMSSSRLCNVIESLLRVTLSFEGTVNLPLKFLRFNIHATKLHVLLLQSFIQPGRYMSTEIDHRKANR